MQNPESQTKEKKTQNDEDPVQNTQFSHKNPKL